MNSKIINWDNVLSKSDVFKSRPGAKLHPNVNNIFT